MRWLEEASGTVRSPTQPGHVGTVARGREVARGLALVGQALLFAGCGGGDAPDPSAHDRAVSEWCSTLCDDVELCYPLIERCAATCPEDHEEYLERMSPEHLLLESACYDRHTGCTGDINALLDACFDEAIDEARSTPAAEEFCAQMAEPFFECSWYSSPQRCAEVFGPSRREVLEQAVPTCGAVECDQLESCIRTNVFGEG